MQTLQAWKKWSRGERGMAAAAWGVSFGENEDVLELVEMGPQFCEYTKTH